MDNNTNGKIVCHFCQYDLRLIIIGPGQTARTMIATFKCDNCSSERTIIAMTYEGKPLPHAVRASEAP